ncbi:GntR family transcriptional regulator [Paenibacillus sp. B-A-8]|uniref:GntR family transcriptional regulator n=1 Tax=Paenibacillus sp. B-A-8 TaxID=3400419 RepID=UPI003B02CBF3
MSEEMDIMDHLIASIQSGEYVSDDKLPSEHELAERFKVPRMTARKAYERLQELGLVYSTQGKGSFVRDRKLRIPLALSAGKSFSKKMIELGFNYESVNIFVRASRALFLLVSGSEEYGLKKNRTFNQVCKNIVLYEHCYGRWKNDCRALYCLNLLMYICFVQCRVSLSEGNCG